ncbi:MAG: acyl carrier protein [Bacteroidales bacterium]|nr:acyl carrier protein [Bacteroidales bacterium]
MDIKQELLDIVKDYVDVPVGEIDTALGLKYVGINSFVVLSMVSNIEEHFNISIPDSKLMEFATLDDIIEFIGGELA